MDLKRFVADVHVPSMPIAMPTPASLTPIARMSEYQAREAEARRLLMSANDLDQNAHCAQSLCAASYLL